MSTAPSGGANQRTVSLVAGRLSEVIYELELLELQATRCDTPVGIELTDYLADRPLQLRTEGQISKDRYRFIPWYGKNGCNADQCNFVTN